MITKIAMPCQPPGDDPNIQALYRMIQQLAENMRQGIQISDIRQFAEGDSEQVIVIQPRSTGPGGGGNTAVAKTPAQIGAGLPEPTLLPAVLITKADGTRQWLHISAGQGIFADPSTGVLSSMYPGMI